jgi:hypothetical protein
MPVKNKYPKHTGDDVLCTYLETAPRNALCTSKTKMIFVIGSAIQGNIIEEIYATKFLTMLADGVTDLCQRRTNFNRDQICW